MLFYIIILDYNMACCIILDFNISYYIKYSMSQLLQTMRLTTLDTTSETGLSPLTFCQATQQRCFMPWG